MMEVHFTHPIICFIMYLKIYCTLTSTSPSMASSFSWERGTSTFQLGGGHIYVSAGRGAHLRFSWEGGTSTFQLGGGHIYVSAGRGAHLRFSWEGGTSTFQLGGGHIYVSAGRGAHLRFSWEGGTSTFQLGGEHIYVCGQEVDFYLASCTSASRKLSPLAGWLHHQ